MGSNVAAIAAVTVVGSYGFEATVHLPGIIRLVHVRVEFRGVLDLKCRIAAYGYFGRRVGNIQALMARVELFDTIRGNQDIEVIICFGV